MATTKHTGAKLRGFLYPIFPDGLGELRQIQKQFRPDYADLERIAKSLPEFTLVSRTITSDEYQWYCALFFTTELGRIAILFPWAYDSKMVDGDDTDRSIAVYITGYVNVDEFIFRFTKVLKEFGKSR